MLPTKVYLLDEKYDAYDVIDTFKSFIWADRYSKCGDFELYIPASTRKLSDFRKDDYVRFGGSDRYMVIEDVNLETNPETGDYIIVSGRSLESILTRRIIWGLTVLSGDFQDAVETLLRRNVIDPSIPERKIENFSFKRSSDPRFSEMTLEAQYFGENLYEEIEKLCTERNVGFKVLPVYPGGFEFSLYFGEDRSYNQSKNPWIIFSPNYKNLAGSNYLSSLRNFKNAALVGGQGEGVDRVTESVSSEDATGLLRRELFVDASNLSDAESSDISEAVSPQYRQQLAQRGETELAATKIIESFDGEVDTSVQFVYGKDFNLGDIVQIANEYGMAVATRVSEMVFSMDDAGVTAIPTFTVASDDGKEQVT